MKVAANGLVMKDANFLVHWVGALGSSAVSVESAGLATQLSTTASAPDAEVQSQMPANPTSTQAAMIPDPQPHPWSAD